MRLLAVGLVVGGYILMLLDAALGCCWRLLEIILLMLLLDDAVLLHVG